MTNQPVRGGGRTRAAHRLAEARSSANADTRGAEAPSIQRLGALRLGVTCRRSGEWTQREMARGAVWRAYPTGALPSRSPQGLGTPGGPQWGYGEAGGVRSHEPGENRLRAEGGSRVTTVLSVATSSSRVSGFFPGNGLFLEVGTGSRIAIICVLQESPLLRV